MKKLSLCVTGLLILSIIMVAPPLEENSVNHLESEISNDLSASIQSQRHDIRSLFDRDNLDDDYPYDMQTIKNMTLEQLNWTNADIDGNGMKDWNITYEDPETGEEKSVRAIEGFFGGEDMYGGNPYSMYTKQQIQEGNLTDPQTISLVHGGILALPHNHSSAAGNGNGIFLNTHGLPSLEDMFFQSIVVSLSNEFEMPVFLMGEHKQNWESFDYHNQDMITFPSLLPPLMQDNSSAELLKMFFPYALLKGNLLGHTVFERLCHEYGMNLDEGIFSEGASKQGFVRWHAAMLDDRIKVAQCDLIHIQDMLNATQRYYIDWGRPPIKDHTTWANYSAQISSLMTAIGDTLVTGLADSSGATQTLYEVWDIHHQAHLLEGTPFISMSGTAGTGGYEDDEWVTDHDGTYFPIGAETNFIDWLDTFDVEWRYGRDRAMLGSAGDHPIDLTRNRMINSWLNGIDYLRNDDLSHWPKVEEVHTQTESYNSTHDWFNVTAHLMHPQENMTVELWYAGNSDRRWNDPEHCVKEGQYPWTPHEMMELDSTTYETSILVRNDLMYGYYVEALAPGISMYLVGNLFNSTRHDASPIRLLNEYPPEVNGVTDLYVEQHELTPNYPQVGEQVNLTVDVVADRPMIHFEDAFTTHPPIHNIDVEFSVNGVVKETKTISLVDMAQVSFSWLVNETGTHELSVFVDSSNVLPEYDEDNNIYTLEVEVYKGIFLDSPYDDVYDYHHKAQMHTHTTNSDGDLDPSELMNMYEDLGYVAVAITDHDCIWWDPCLEDPGGHNIIHIPGIEYSNGHHMATVGIETIRRRAQNERQLQIDQANKEGGLSYYAHPDRYDKEYSREYYEHTEGYSGMEIINRGSIERESDVDFVLSELGREITLTSVDDFHGGTPNRGFISILSDKPAENLSYEDVMNYLHEGRFYARGHRDAEDPPRLDIWTEGDIIYVESDKVVDIEFTTTNYNYYKEGENYAKIVTDTTEANYTAQFGDGYVRIKATHEGERDSYAFSNPIYVRLQSERSNIVIEPAEETVTAGDDTVFQATAYDEAGVKIEDVTVETEWSIDAGGGGSWSENVYTSEFAGEWTVTGTYTHEGENMTGTAALTVEPSDPAHIEILPAEELIIAGDRLRYTTVAYDEFGNEIGVVTDETAWSIDEGAGGTWEDNVYTSEFTGTWYVTGNYGELSDTATLMVEETDPVYIEILPNNAVVTAGTSRTYTAVAYDEGGNMFNVTAEVSWSIDAGAGGTWEDNVYISENAGTWIVTGTYGVLTDTATLIVEEADPAYVAIIPDSNQTITAGETVDFSAAAFDEYGNLITDEDTAFEWYNTDETGLFDRTNSGVYDVTATYNEVSSELVTVTVIAGEIDYIEILPAEENVIAGDRLTYYSVAYDEFGNRVEDVTEYTDWSIDEGAGGTWEDNVYTSEFTGTWTVTGTYGELTETAVLAVEEISPIYITLSPEESIVTAGDSQKYYAEAFDEDGNSFNITAETDWSIEAEAGGSWEDNVYTPEVVGTWTVTGTYEYGGEVFTDDTALSVEPADVYAVYIHPSDDVTIYAGQVGIFTVEAYDPYGNLIDNDARNFTWQNVDEIGAFYHRTAGVYPVTATLDGVTSEVTNVTLLPGDPYYIEIHPYTNQTITAGETINFSAAVYDEYDNMITDEAANFTWENVTDGVFNQVIAGDYQVTASYDGIVSDSTTVTVEPADVSSVSIFPDEPETVLPGEDLVFTAGAYDPYGNLITNTVTDFIWQNATDGVFNQEIVGEYLVTAAYDGVTSPATTVTVVDEFEITLLADSEADGWNFVSFNLVPVDTTLSEILNHEDKGIGGSYDRVMYYDASTDEWLSYVPGRADHFNNLEQWDHTMGIWIRMVEDDTLTIEGIAPTSTDITLYPGWNMVGYPSETNRVASDALPEEVTKIGVFNRYAPYNVEYIDDLSTVLLVTGRAYWVYNGEEYSITWTVEY